MKRKLVSFVMIFALLAGQVVVANAGRSGGSTGGFWDAFEYNSGNTGGSFGSGDTVSGGFRSSSRGKDIPDGYYCNLLCIIPVLCNHEYNRGTGQAAYTEKVTNMQTTFSSTVLNYSGEFRVKTIQQLFDENAVMVINQSWQSGELFLVMPRGFNVYLHDGSLHQKNVNYDWIVNNILQVFPVGQGYSNHNIRTGIAYKKEYGGYITHCLYDIVQHGNFEFEAVRYDNVKIYMDGYLYPPITMTQNPTAPKWDEDAPAMSIVIPIPAPDAVTDEEKARSVLAQVAATPVTQLVVTTENVGTINPPINPPAVGGINWPKLTAAWSGLASVFPFCLPFDVINIFRGFSAEGTMIEPIEVNIMPFIPGNAGMVRLDFNIDGFDTLVRIFRIGMLLLFCVGLIMTTRSLITW